jgi:hypothetical protein
MKAHQQRGAAENGRAGGAGSRGELWCILPAGKDNEAAKDRVSRVMCVRKKEAPEGEPLFHLVSLPIR